MSTAAIEFKLLDDEYFNGFIQNHKIPFTPIGEFTYYRTYSPYDFDLSRRETGHETFRRAVEYNTSLVEHILPVEQWEAIKLFENHANLKQFLSGRTLWVGGREVSLRYPMSNFNCSFLIIEQFEDFCDLFYLLMVGTGVGHRELLDDTEQLSPIKTNIKLWYDNYIPVPRGQRKEFTELTFPSNTHAHITVGDSKEGWVQSLGTYFELLTDRQYRTLTDISINFSNVRPKKERLKKFGGTASGYEALRDIFTRVQHVLRDRGNEQGKIYAKLKPVDVLDICNIIGKGVVVGGVRRTAEDGLGDVKDREWQFAKFGINGFFTESQLEFAKEAKIRFPDLPEVFPAEKAAYRRMSNNSIFYEEKPSREDFANHMFLLRGEGEPCFLNAEAARKRRRWFAGVNPCFEILLASKGLCNLTTLVVTAFINYVDGKAVLDLEGILEAQRLSARAGVRMTCVDLELHKWDIVQKRDRLIGTSFTGWQDAMDALEYTVEEQNELLVALRKASRESADEYADQLGIPRPLLTTTIKPEGTQSIMAGAKSPGIHRSHSPFHIRRIRVSYADPMAKAVMCHKGWVFNPEVGEDWVEHWDIVDSNFNVVEVFYNKGEAEDKLIELKEEHPTYQINYVKQIETLVVDFPVKTTVKKTKYDVTAIEQLETYKQFQRYYSEHNCFVRDTRFITDKGIKSFHDFEPGDNVNVIAEDRKWSKSIIVKSTPKKVMRIVLKNTGSKSNNVKTIFASDDHRWVTSTPQQRFKGAYTKKLTKELNQGDILEMRFLDDNLVPDVVGIRHGIVFGDGTLYSNKNFSHVYLCGEKRELRKYFDNVTERDDINQTRVYGLSNKFKDVPLANSSREYLLGFFIGWLATDGSISADGKNVSISCSDRAVIEWALEVLPSIGLSFGEVREQITSGYENTKPCYQVTIRKPSINKEWLIRSKHYSRFKDSEHVKYWKVVSVEDTGRVEELWCVQEPRTGKFVLEDNILTFNTSNTITVREHEWSDVEQWLWDNWDETIAVSFLSLDDHTYRLAPYESITEEQYEELSSQMEPFNSDILAKFDTAEDFELGEGCEGMACPAR